MTEYIVCPAPEESDREGEFSCMFILEYGMRGSLEAKLGWNETGMWAVWANGKGPEDPAPMKNKANSLFLT